MPVEMPVAGAACSNGLKATLARSPVEPAVGATCQSGTTIIRMEVPSLGNASPMSPAVEELELRELSVDLPQPIWHSCPVSCSLLQQPYQLLSLKPLSP